ncbi:MAG: pyridoxamine 5'-phosphate oxidase [Phycisphaerae bacterium]|nr:MAG: pyridoxamine 5'-phosphate oxidase [Phycisphaerae bacterium]
MKPPVSDIAFTPSVKAVQKRLGSRKGYESMEQRGGWSDVVTPELEAFIAERDTFFIATTNAEGQPYIQHRGGPPGFLKVIDEHTLGFADFSGNRQYITVGNLDHNPKAFIFLLDFANRRRIKIWGRAEVIENDGNLRERLHHPEYGSEPERMFLFHVDAWDVNCPKHIKPRFTEEEIGDSIIVLRARIKELEEQVRTVAVHKK